jgi:uncharacterized GH25 family protein
LIRSISKAEAETFMKVANFAVKSGNANYLFKNHNGKLLSDTSSILYGDIALLIDIGLIQPGDFVNFQVPQQQVDNQIVMTSGKIVIIAKVKANTPIIQMPVSVFTNAGNELLKLINLNPPFDYLSAIAKSIKNDNVDVKWGNIQSWDGYRIKSKPSEKNSFKETPTANSTKQL